ncbi:potassium channel family protein [Dietzia lutea]|uniref:Transporter n=1 Tax=Dietzia lutea TaxID=546160 RepID=A0A2S1R4A6_9ACTN|nr:potassium channel family protein [Dietzia lutea]AWH91130.1 transporter [Dietzia lutea]
MVEIVCSVVGLALIVLVLLDVFHTLMHPAGSGYMSPHVFALVWRVSRATGHRVAGAVGPTAVVTVILVWVALVGLAWGLIYYPHVPADFTYSDGIDPHSLPAFAEALYFSFVTLATVGFGDMVPSGSWIRWASPLQALMGFALLTAALTWFNQVYPPLLRRRALAQELSRLAEVDYARRIPELPVDPVCARLAAVTDKVEAVRIDFFQHSEGFYFREKSADLSLPRQLAHAVRLSELASEGSHTAVQLGSRQLAVALDRLASTLDQQFLHNEGSPSEVFASYLDEHHP